MDFDKILFEAKSIIEDNKKFKNKKDFKKLNSVEFSDLLDKKYIYLKTNVPSIYKQCIEETMDLEVLSFMINQAKDIKKNKISNHDASVKVGEKLVNKYIKPHIDTKPDLDKDNHENKDIDKDIDLDKDTQGK